MKSKVFDMVLLRYLHITGGHMSHLVVNVTWTDVFLSLLGNGKVNTFLLQ
jgi:hypothetical protein